MQWNQAVLSVTALVHTTTMSFLNSEKANLRMFLLMHQRLLIVLNTDLEYNIFLKNTL